MRPSLPLLFASLAMLLLVLSSPALAQSPATPSPGPAARPEPWRLHAALGLPDWITLEGSELLRYAALANQFRPGLDRNDQLLNSRVLLRAGISLEYLSVLGELQDARASLDDAQSAVSAIDVDAVEPIQLYAGLHLDDLIVEGASLDVKAGRQTMDLGGRRLIARNRFRATLQTYDGLTAQWLLPKQLDVFAFYTLPVEILPGNAERDALRSNRITLDRSHLSRRLFGLFLTRPLSSLRDTHLELYAFGLQEEDEPGEFETADRHIYTPGLRLYRAPGAADWDIDVEGTLQFGRRMATASAEDTTPLDVFAHFLHASLGYTWATFLAPRLSLELDYGSGDASPSDTRYGRFDSLYGPRRAELGPTTIYGIMGRENTLSIGPRQSLASARRWDGYLALRANFLPQATDTFSRSGVRDPTGQSGRYAGTQLELRSRTWLIHEVLRWELGGAIFFNGRFMNDAPNATGYGDTFFGYTDLTLSF